MDKTKSYLVTGCCGLVGYAVTEELLARGHHVIGIDNNNRKRYFNLAKDTYEEVLASLSNNWPERFLVLQSDISSKQCWEDLSCFVADRNYDVVGIVHTAAQPSHDWATINTMRDFEVNAIGTLRMLEWARDHASQANIVYTSTNKVYGDRINNMEMTKEGDRFEPSILLAWRSGISEEFPVDDCLHSFFGCSKLVADLYCQEYGKHLGMNTIALRLGCITGPMHRGAELHGFLSYLTKCAVTKKTYKIYGYDGYQVRDNIHADDLRDLIVPLVVSGWDYNYNGDVFNCGGGRVRSCSVREAITHCEKYLGTEMDWISFPHQVRTGDHKWWITDNSKLAEFAPWWSQQYTLDKIFEDLLEHWNTAL